MDFRFFVAFVLTKIPIFFIGLLFYFGHLGTFLLGAYSEELNNSSSLVKS